MNRVAVIRPFYHSLEDAFVRRFNKCSGWEAELLVCEGSGFSTPCEGDHISYFKTSFSFGNFPVSRLLIRFIKKGNYRVLNVSEVFQPMTLFLLFATRRPLWITLEKNKDSSSFLIGLGLKISILLCNTIFRRRIHYLAHSKSAAEYHQAHGLKWDKSRDRVIPIGVDERKFFLQPPDSAGIALHGIVGSSTAPLLVSIARFVDFKNIDYTMELFAKIKEFYPEASFVLVGKGPGEGRIRERINALELDNAVRILDYVPHEELPAILGRATCFILLSRICVFEVAALEALACGTPVITSDIGAFRDYVNEFNGIRLDLNDDLDTHRDTVVRFLNELPDRDRVRQSVEPFFFSNLMEQYRDFFSLQDRE